MRKFREQDLCEVNAGTVTEKQIQDAEEIIGIWEAVKPMFNTHGWQIFIKEVRRIHDKLDCLSNCDTDYNRFIYQKGEVSGIKRFLNIPMTLQQNATSASEILESGLAQDEE